MTPTTPLRQDTRHRSGATRQSRRLSPSSAAMLFDWGRALLVAIRRASSLLSKSVDPLLPADKKQTSLHDHLQRRWVTESVDKETSWVVPICLGIAPHVSIAIVVVALTGDHLTFVMLDGRNIIGCRRCFFLRDL